MAELPIVGIGSSAGGLEALQKLFGAMPADSGIAFVVAAHLDPTHESHLSELLGRCTAMPVVEIEQDTEVEADHVYVIAPDQALTIKDGILRPGRPEEPRGQRRPVDGFFRALAEDQGERASAIVLSGTGTNGSQGIRFIKAEGGAVIVQDPETAGFDGMPRNAIATGLVDVVLAPEQMPDAVLGFARHSYVRTSPDMGEMSDVDGELATLLEMVRNETGQDFRPYRRNTLLRRTHRRMGLHQIEHLEDYIRRLRNDPEEMRALTQDFTINVSGFFRDREAWATLDEKVITPLVEERDADSTIRVWVPGCATGEEAFSLAVMLTERAEAAGKRFDVRIFATDVAKGVLLSAREGLYPASVASDVGEHRLRRFFDAEDDAYRVKRPLREMVTFAPQNLLQDPPFSRVDLITCRNLLVYLEPDTQKKLLGLFHFALRDGGYLFLGNAESISGRENLFEQVSKQWRIYRRVGPTRHDIVEFPLVRGGASERRRGSDHQPAEVGPQHSGERWPRGQEAFQRALLDEHAPPSVLIDRSFQVHAYQGETGNYLQQPGGQPASNLIALAREGLQLPLRRAVQRAIQTNRRAEAEGQVRRGGTFHQVYVVAAPLRARSRDGMLMVSFFERAGAPAPPAPAQPREELPESELQAELDATREDLRLTMEQMETSNEELTASYEEVRSINEELQAANEELETSKEELQSLNEELKTVNSQLQAKVEELDARTNDLNNLLNSTDVATLFLDRKMHIRWFTPAMKELLELRPADVGRPVDHFAQRFTGSDLMADAEKVLRALTPEHKEVRGENERAYIQHMLPYRTEDNRIDGVVVTFTDITERKRAEEEVIAAKEFAESIIDTVRESLLVLTPELRVVSANESFYHTFHVSCEETEGELIYHLGNNQWDIPELRRLLEDILPTDEQFEDFEVEQDFETLGRRTMLLNGRRLDHVQLMLLAIQDITERKRAEAALRASEERLRRVLETDAVGVIFFDRAGTVVDCNEVFLRVTGHSRSEVDARELTWRKMTPPEWIAESEEQMRKMEATGRIGPYEKEHLLKDGSRCWMLFAGADLGDGTIVEYCIDISARKRAEEERELLARELSHRVKNTLAVVQALAMQTDGQITSVEAFREAFVGRLQAMARAHALLLDAHWQSADLKSLVEQTIAAYQVDDPEVVAVEGDPVVITPKQGLGLSLVLHELGTNAAKYGALSSSEGRLRVSWQVEHGSAPRLRLTWQERHGPKVEPPTEKGFGLQLIERACTYELEGEVELDYAPEGLTCVVVFPLA